MTHEELLNRYANRGAPRGAQAVFDGAMSQRTSRPAEPLVLPVDPTATRRLLVRPALVACVLVALGIVGYVATGAQEDDVTDVEANEAALGSTPEGSVGSATSEDDCVDPGPRRATVSEEEQRSYEERFAALRRLERETGWASIANRHVIDGSWVCGWTPTVTSAFQDIEASPVDAATSLQGLPRVTVYDEPDGALSGFIYGAVAFVPVEVATEPGVDIDSLIERMPSGPTDEATDGDHEQDISAAENSESHSPSVPLPTPGDDTVGVAPGWMAYVIDARTDEVGYVRTTEFMTDLNGIPVFAAPDGQDLRGYAVPYLGFVDRATYEAPGFDLEQHARDVLGDAAVDDHHERFGVPPG